MRLGIIILLVSFFFSCKEEPESCYPNIQSKDQAKEFLIGLWMGSDKLSNFNGWGKIEVYIPNHSIIYNSEFEILSKNEILITRDFPWMDSVRFVNELGGTPEDWSPWYEEFKEPTLHLIRYFNCDSMMIENFWPENKDSTPEEFVWKSINFSRIND